MPQSVRLPVLVFGTGITTLGVIRSLVRSGITTYCSSRRLDFVRRSRYCRFLPEEPNRIGKPNELEGFLRSIKLQRAVVVPCSDEWAVAIAALPADLAERFPSSLPASDTLNMMVNKRQFEEFLSAHDYPHPRTITLRGEDDLRAIPAEYFTDSFLKPCDSERFFRTYWRKAFRVKSNDDALVRYRDARGHGLDMVFQEYVPGPASNHYFLDGFVDSGGTVRAMFVRQRLRMYPPDFGNSTYMVTVPPEHAADAVETLTDILARTNYRGIFSAEFKRDDRVGRFKLLEINARPWWYIWCAERCGVPVAAMAYRDALGESVETVDTYETGVHIVYPYFDMYRCYEMWREGSLGLGAWLASWLSARQAVFFWPDPIPSLAWAFRELSTTVARKLRRKGH